MKIFILAAGMVTAAAVPATAQVASQIVQADAIAQTPALVETVDVGTDNQTAFEGLSSVPADQLAVIAGQSDINQMIQAQNRSQVSNNSVSGNSVTGTISFDGSSFANLNGLSVLSANTGNNVSINASMNVNVAIRP